MKSLLSDIKDPSLADKGKLKIEWAANSMPVLRLLLERYRKTKPFKGYRIGACLHVTAETANLMIALKTGGAAVSLCASNPLSTQDDVAAALAINYKIPTYAIKGEDKITYYRHLNFVLDTHPNITMDDGADLVTMLHTQRQKQLSEIIGSSEETTTGVIRLKAMEKDKALHIPVYAVNDSETKHLFDNRYGTGQSTIDGIMRSTNMLIAGKTFVVCGYGWCGRGLAQRARGMGAHVIVCEINAIKSLEAVMDGFMVRRLKEAIKTGDIFVTVTGNKNIISYQNMCNMKDGAVIANSGHFNVEIDIASLEKNAKSKRNIRPFVDEYILNIQNPKTNISKEKRLFVLGQGRLINLTAAEGHPAEVMDMSFANQALAVEFFIKNKGKLKNKVYKISAFMDQKIASLKLKAMGVFIDRLTGEQKKYLSSWNEGT